MLAKAIAIAAEGFKNKKDKAGKPYILHCLTVMNNLHSDDEELNCIAVLHDCVEDGVCTFKELYEYGFSQRVVAGVDILTHKKGISYDDYIKLVALHPDCVKVKMADLKHNSDITRLKGLTKKDFDRMEQYHKSYVYLSKVG